MARLDHVGLKVTDLERSVRFYNELFGFEVVDRRTIGRNIDNVALRVGDSIVFLLNRADFESRDPESLSGGDHVAFAFEPAEWERVTARARERGTPISKDLPNVMGASGWGPSLYILDPDGNEIEIKRM